MKSWLKLFFLSILIGNVVPIMAQETEKERKFKFEVDVQYQYGFSEKLGGKKFTHSDVSLDGKSLQVFGLYPGEKKKLEYGLGLGLTRLDGIEYNTFSILGLIRYKPLNKLPDAFVSLTYGQHVKGDDFTPGCTGELGIGYSWKVYKNIRFMSQMGYNYNRLKSERYIETGKKKTFHSDRHSFAIKFGFIF